jgi:hypothetical protein
MAGAGLCNMLTGLELEPFMPFFRPLSRFLNDCGDCNTSVYSRMRLATWNACNVSRVSGRQVFGSGFRNVSKTFGALAQTLDTSRGQDVSRKTQDVLLLGPPPGYKQVMSCFGAVYSFKEIEKAKLNKYRFTRQKLL